IASAGNASSGAFSSWRQTTSGRSRPSHSSKAGKRDRIPLMLNVATLKLPMRLPRNQHSRRGSLATTWGFQQGDTGRTAHGAEPQAYKNPSQLTWVSVFGRDGVLRTLDPLHPMQVRYQAALRPDCALRSCHSGTHYTLTNCNPKGFFRLCAQFA